MELTLYASATSQLCNSIWPLPHNSRLLILKSSKPIEPKTSIKPLTLSCSLKTSSNFNDEFQKEEKLNSCHLNYKIPENFAFPVVIRQSGAVLRYFWNGKKLKLVYIDELDAMSLSDFLNSEDGMTKLGRVCGSAVRNFFLPREVSEYYLEYVKWKFLHRVFSSALQVLATQAMFRAIGIGYSRSLPSAAALNWVLKDGLGRLSRCIYTASLASAFDTNLKRVRFWTSALFSLSIGVELLTPAFPKYFLLLATIANIAKQISLACYLATGSAVHRSFAIADNLGEISAKAQVLGNLICIIMINVLHAAKSDSLSGFQIQTVCFDNIGLLLAATLNILFRNNQRLLAGLPFIVYPVFSGIDLFGIYQGLKHVHLQTLTKDRLELIINTWIQLGYVPSPAEVSKKEGIGFFCSKGMELLPIRIGYLNPKRKIPKLSMMTMRSLSDEDFYFTCMESLNAGFRLRDHGILLCLREGAGTSDVIMGLLQACYIRKGLLLEVISWENGLEDFDCSDSVLREWFMLMEESKISAQNNLCPLNEHMSRLGWACRNILLRTPEQARYSFVPD